MLVGFICPGGKRVKLDECYAGCLHRCVSLATLRRAGRQREWLGKPSTTQLLSGTRCEYLKLVKDYYVTPESRAFAILGTVHHERLADDDLITEQTFEQAKVTGTCDLLELDGRGGYRLYDYKTWGSYKVARFLGMTFEYIDDPTGATYQRQTTVGGRRFYQGQPKQVKLWSPNPLVADTLELELQLNHYRLLAQRAGFNVNEMWVQFTVRDGGTVVARGNGIDWRMRCCPVGWLADDVVVDYFGHKAESLMRALDTGGTLACTPEECWDGRKCGQYCEVAEWCDKGLRLKADITGGEADAPVD